MNAINEDLGTPMSAAEVAKSVGVATSTVIKYAESRFGAIRVGDRLLFFDKRVKDALKNAIQEGQEMDGPRSKNRSRQNPAVRLQGRGPGLGSPGKVSRLERTGTRGDEARHGLGLGWSFRPSKPCSGTSPRRRQPGICTHCAEPRPPWTTYLAASWFS